jgi:hypothetical protein
MRIVHAAETVMLTSLLTVIGVSTSGPVWEPITVI